MQADCALDICWHVLLSSKKIVAFLAGCMETDELHTHEEPAVKAVVEPSVPGHDDVLLPVKPDSASAEVSEKEALPDSVLEAERTAATTAPSEDQITSQVEDVKATGDAMSPSPVASEITSETVVPSLSEATSPKVELASAVAEAGDKTRMPVAASETESPAEQVKATDETTSQSEEQVASQAVSKLTEAPLSETTPSVDTVPEATSTQVTSTTAESSVTAGETEPTVPTDEGLLHTQRSDSPAATTSRPEVGVASEKQPSPLPESEVKSAEPDSETPPEALEASASEVAAQASRESSPQVDAPAKAATPPTTQASEATPHVPAVEPKIKSEHTELGPPSTVEVITTATATTLEGPQSGPSTGFAPCVTSSSIHYVQATMSTQATSTTSGVQPTTSAGGVVVTTVITARGRTAHQWWLPPFHNHTRHF